MTIEDKPVNIMASNQTTGISVNLSTGEVNAGTVQFRNRIINGDMRIDQRNVSMAIAGENFASVYTLDRWLSERNNGMTFTVQQNTDVPSGYQNSIKIDSTIGSVNTTSYGGLYQYIEANMLTDAQWGTSLGYPLTLSFWMKFVNIPASSVVYVEIDYYGATNYAFYAPFTMFSPNTWEYKSITIPPPPTTPFTGLHTARLLAIRFMRKGTLNTNSQTPSTWVSSLNGYPSNVTLNLGNSVFTQWITGVQLEKGSKATPFEFRPYPVELQLCQRYFQKFQISGNGQFSVSGYIGGSATQGNKVLITTLPLIPRMRTVPTGFCYKSGTFGYNATWYTIDFYYNPNGTPASDVSLPATGTVSVNHYGYDSLYDTGFITMLPGASSLPVLANSTFAYARDLKIDFTAEL